MSIEEEKPKSLNFDSGYLITYVKQDKVDLDVFKRLIIDTKRIFMTFGYFDM